uniref:KIB1-4 beta-propeller domain-containing protein n=1 Tax=Aegilops tauschii TaxID=37682 RepID=M8C535_AEGTA
MVLPGLHTLNDRHKAVMQGPTIRKLLVCSDDLVAATVVQETGTEPWRTGTSVLRLALCRPGASSWSWSWALTSFPYIIIKNLQDIVLYKGQLYALNMERALFALVVSNKRGVTHEPVVSRVRCVIDTNHPTRTPFIAAPPFYLLESHGTLLLIYKRGELDGKKRKKKPLQGSWESDMATKFVVFVADFQRFRWKRAGCNTELRRAVPEDRVLFLGPWCSRSLALTQDHQDRGYINMGGNSIVFFFDEDGNGRTDEYHRKRVPFHCSIYDIKTRRSQSLLQTSVRPWKGFQATWMFPPSQKS